MPLVFSKDNLVSSFANAAQILQETLISAGWALESGGYGNPPFVMSSGYAMNGEKAWIRFGNQLEAIRLNGLINGLTASDNFDSPAIATNTRFWVTADEEAFVYSLIYPSSFHTNYGGWREQKLSIYHWGLGLLKDTNTSQVDYLAGLPGQAGWIGNTTSSNLIGNYLNAWNVGSGNGNMTEQYTGKLIVAPYMRGRGSGFTGFVKFINAHMSGSIPGNEYPPDSQGRTWLGVGNGGILVGVA